MLIPCGYRRVHENRSIFSDLTSLLSGNPSYPVGGDSHTEEILRAGTYRVVSLDLVEVLPYPEHAQFLKELAETGLGEFGTPVLSCML